MSNFGKSGVIKHNGDVEAMTASSVRRPKPGARVLVRVRVGDQQLLPAEVIRSIDHPLHGPLVDVRLDEPVEGKREIRLVGARVQKGRA